MNLEDLLKRPVPQPTQDARDLQTMLYREIGISAVAAALNATSESRKPREEPVHELPAILRGDDVAA